MIEQKGLPATVPRSVAIYTPDELAVAIVDRVYASKEQHWLEPCAGDGAFLRAIARRGVNPANVTALDFETTPEPADALAETHRGIDFIQWSLGRPPAYDAIVANPPFIAVSRLPEQLRKRALAINDLDGRRVAGTTNYWCCFLLRSMELLRPGGAIAFVLPAAWEYADYAARLRSLAPTHFRDFDVFRSSEPLFKGVQDGSVVLLATGYGQGPSNVRRWNFSRGVDLVDGLSQSGDAKAPSTVVLLRRRAQAPTVRLGDVMRIGIGAVTGDSRYFLLTESDRVRRRLPVRALHQVVTRARHLVGSELRESGWRKLRIAGQRVWLFRPPDAMLTHPAVTAYLALDPDKGGCRREALWVGRREPWHRVDLPTRPHGFVSGMTRHGPWIALNATGSVTATNTLYTVRFRSRLDTNAQAAWCLGLLTTSVRREIEPAGRRYPDGLLKYEPRDLRDIELPVPRPHKAARRVYQIAVHALLNGRPTDAEEIADRFFRDA